MKIKIKTSAENWEKLKTTAARVDSMPAWKKNGIALATPAKKVTRKKS